MAIRWKNEDIVNLRKAVQKFNAKRTRVLKSKPNLSEFQPEKANVADIRDSITNRNDLNKKLRELERYSRKGAENPITTKQGIKTTVYEKNEIAIKVRNINIRRAYERKIADVSTYKGTMGALHTQNLLPKPFNIDNMSRSEWGKYVESVEKQARSAYTKEKIDLYKKNYLKAFDEQINDGELKQRIEKIPAKRLMELFYENPRLQLDFVYDPHSRQIRINEIESALDELGE